MQGIMKVQEQRKLATATLEAVEKRREDAAIITDPREIELRHGIGVAKRSGNKGQVKLYTDKLKEYLDGIEPGLYVKREMELLGEDFFKTFPVLDTYSWQFKFEGLEKTVRRVFDGEAVTAQIKAQTETFYGFRIEVAPGVNIYYPMIVKNGHRTRKAWQGENEAADYEGRMIPVAGLELVEKAKESDWFERIMVLDPQDPQKHVQEVKKMREEQLAQYVEMLERDPLIVGIGLDQKPRYIYHWIGVDEQAMTKDAIAEMVRGLEGMVNEKFV